MSENGRTGLWAALMGMLLNPGETFEKLFAEERPRFLATAFLFTGISLVLSLALIPKMQQLMLWTLEHTPNLTPEMIAAQRPMIPIMAVVTSIASGLFTPWLYWLAVATVLKLYDMLSAKGAAFGTLFAVAVYGFLPEFLGLLMLNIIMFFAPIQNWAWTSLSLASLLPAQKTFFYFFLTKCNPFTWWSLALWGSGYVRYAKVKSNAPLFVLFGLWLLLALVMAVYALNNAANIPG